MRSVVRGYQRLPRHYDPPSRVDASAPRLLRGSEGRHRVEDYHASRAYVERALEGLVGGSTLADENDVRGVAGS